METYPRKRVYQTKMPDTEFIKYHNTSVWGGSKAFVTRSAQSAFIPGNGRVARVCCLGHERRLAVSCELECDGRRGHT